MAEKLRILAIWKKLPFIHPLNNNDHSNNRNRDKKIQAPAIHFESIYLFPGIS